MTDINTNLIAYEVSLGETVWPLFARSSPGLKVLNTITDEAHASALHKIEIPLMLASTHSVHDALMDTLQPIRGRD